MFTPNRDAYRQVFFTTWQKYQEKCLLQPIEAQLIEVILEHPEYHALLDRPTTHQKQDFSLEENPFVHMSLHLTIREQIRTNRPAGITSLYQQLCHQYEKPHQTEHQMIHVLAQLLWQAQQSGEAPHEEVYLNKLRELICL